MLLRGTEGADVLTGAGEDDTIYGFGGADTLRGGAGDDVLAGNDGNDKLYGGDGDDYLLGGAGDDLIDGGAGNDWAAYEDATAGVTVDLTKTGAQNTGGSGRDTLIGIENVYGSDFNDVLTGDAQNNMLVGGKGDDKLYGGKGDDTLWGSEGNDTLEGGDGDDYLVGGAGDDIIKGGAGWDWSSYEDAGAGVTVDLTKTGQQDTIGAGKDTLSGIEHLYGSKFNDVLTGDANNNYLWGDAGDDKLYGGAGDDHLSGGAGVNLIDGGEGWDTVDYAFAQVGVDIDLSRNTAKSRTGASIQDTLVSIEAAMGSAFDDYLTGNAAENYLFGDAGNDILWAFGGHDTLDGGDGDDILFGSNLGEGDLLLGGAGNDTIIVCAGEAGKVSATADGGTGVDTLQFNTYLDITFNLANTGNQQVGINTQVTAQNFENLVGGYANDRLTGDAGDNVIEGRDGNDVLDGGAGFDIASYASATSAVRVDLSKVGVAQDTRGAGIDTLTNFEGLKGSKYGDILIGDAKDNTFEGGAGDDIIDGGAGNDTAIYNGKSADYTWARNANGTWTVRGAEGVDTLLNIETLKFIDKSVALSPSETTVTVDDLTSSTKVLVSSQGSIRDAILSADGLTAYVSSSDGHVKAIDTVTGQVRADIKVGNLLGGMDVSADGRYLAIAETQVIDRHSPGGSPAPMAAIHVVDLQTGTVKDYTTFVNAAGFVDVAFMDDGKIIVTEDYSGSGFPPVMMLDPATGDFVKGPENRYSQAGVLSVTDDHKTVLLAPTNISSGPIYLLTADMTEVASHNHFTYSDGVQGFNFGMQAIAGDGSRIAQWNYPGEIHIYDGALKHLVQIGEYSPYSINVHGMDFSADGKHLYVVDAVKDQIYDFSTDNWALNEVYAIGADVVVPDRNFGAGQGYGDSVSLSRDGLRMIIMDDNKVISLNMAMLKLAGGTDAADTLQGGYEADLLRGFGGDDTITGGYGDDTLIGGKGADTLSGGDGDDTFVFAKGDTTWTLTSDAGVDVILDWQATDRLSFGPHSGVLSYGEQTATSWTAAATIAPQIMAQQHLTYLAMQVGADVYVFAGQNGTMTGAIESVVKLANTTLDKISADNFTPVGDDGANILIGGALNDRIYGYDGNDTIKGGKGADILFGGAGIDTFVFDEGDSIFTASSDAGLDVIMDWEASDKLSFGSLPPAFQFAKLQAGTWSEALSNASQPISDPHPAYLAYQVGADIYLFYKASGATDGVTNAVKLANTTLDKIDITSVIPHVGLPIEGDDNANVLTGGVLDDYINGKGGDDVINGGKGNDVLTGGAGADTFKFMAGDGLYNPSLKNFDTITDFGPGDKLAFEAVTTPGSNAGVWNAGQFHTLDAATLLTLEAYATGYIVGNYAARYLMFGVGNDTYVLADTDGLRPGYDQIVVLKNFSSSLVTADMFTTV